MATDPLSTGNFAENPERLFGRADANRVVAGPLGREMRAAKNMSNEVLAKLTGISERRIEMLRSFTEETPVYLEDILSIGSVLGARFITGILSEIDMHAARFNGASPEKIAAEAISMLQQITGGDGK